MTELQGSLRENLVARQPGSPTVLWGLHTHNSFLLFGFSGDRSRINPGAIFFPAERSQDETNVFLVNIEALGENLRKSFQKLTSQPTPLHEKYSMKNVEKRQMKMDLCCQVQIKFH